MYIFRTKRVWGRVPGDRAGNKLVFSWDLLTLVVLKSFVKNVTELEVILVPTATFNDMLHRYDMS